MAKTNMLTMRVSDELLAKLNACEGDSMAAKFENLVYTCCDKLPEVKKRCADAQIQLDKLRTQCRELQQLWKGWAVWQIS